MLNIKPAKILRITDNGVGYINDTNDNNITVFFFDQIKGYKGETAKELCLISGKEVMVEYDSSQHIQSVSATAH